MELVPHISKSAFSLLNTLNNTPCFPGQRLAMDWAVRGSSPHEGENFVPIQTGPWPHAVSYTTCTGLFSVAKRPVINHPPSFSAEVKERVELYLYSLSGPSCPTLG